MVQGPWDDPLIFPDPESLIRRSPASAPLLDAVKDRKTRDAVRSVIDSLRAVVRDRRRLHQLGRRRIDAQSGTDADHGIPAAQPTDANTA